MDALAARLARFHAENALGVPAPFTSEEWLARCMLPALEYLRALGASELVPRELVVRAGDRLNAFAAEHADRFERRRRAGRAVDAHGDLHLQHVWYERAGADPIEIDGLEFSEKLRQIDVASEVAFFAMDLSYRHVLRRAATASSLSARVGRVHAGTEPAMKAVEQRGGSRWISGSVRCPTSCAARS